MGNRLKGKVALVTDSGQGMGREIAIVMVREGARVLTNDYECAIAESIAKQITDMGGQAISFPGDISDFQLTRKTIQAAIDNFGSMDILVNNAAIVGGSWIWDMSEEEWDRVVAVDLKGSFNCMPVSS